MSVSERLLPVIGYGSEYRTYREISTIYQAAPFARDALAHTTLFINSHILLVLPHTDGCTKGTSEVMFYVAVRGALN